MIGQKTSPLFSTGKQIKYKTDDDYFFFTIFQKSGGYSVCESFVAVFCLLFFCLRTPLGGEDQSTRIKKQTLLMNGRCGLLSYGSRGDDAVFQEHLNLIQTVFQNRKS